MNHILSTFNFSNPPLHKNHNEIRRGNGRFGSNRADRIAVSARFRSKPKLSQTLHNQQTKTKAPLNLEGSGAQVFDEEGSDKFELSKEEEDDDDDESGGCSDDSGWTQEELDAISALFDRPIPRKPVKPSKERPLPLPSPYKTRPDGIPTPKRHIRSNAARSDVSSRLSFSDRVRKNPQVLVKIAREIAALPSPESDVSAILDRYAPFLRKGSLSMTIRELGHMGLPERALQTLLWAQKQQQQQKNGLFPDDQILASTVQVLARFGRLKLGSEIKNYLSSASRSVLEAMARGFIRAGNLNLARKILLLAKDGRRTLDSSIHAKLILEAGKTPDGYKLASALLDELGEREEFDLKPQDCTAVMKVCVRLRRFEAVESLFDWFKESGRRPSVVMYTTVMHSRYCDGKYREGLALIWEMEGSNCLLDLPAYRVVIKLCIASNDLARAVRYFSRLKEAGFVPTHDIYCNVIKVYAAFGRVAKCKQLCREAESVGLKLDGETVSLLGEMENVR
ncbi:pentatricopeptide repeat-containing protein At2g01860-like [Ananas comosus]|uniref:Pentatricopeptide repeat-containing protein At2g01860-like n=1 Tax=Ananas comosus TaxID=4615 RepID=A0A6P5FDS5_ANACO|nr:pentatricopeptide repeat-containing protein At2g01860-like [Ananas comosus]